MPAPQELLPSEQQKEVLFKGILVNTLYDVIKESLENTALTEDEVTAFLNSVKQFPEEEILSTLALPHELQPKIFTRFAEQLHAGKITVKGFVEQLHQRALNNGYRLGFHISKRDIEPTESADGETEKWEINGTEQDHRDEDLLRAYYSFDYQHLYRKKPGNFLYLIRAETGPASAHKKDNDGAWGRASSLPIVARMNLREVDRQIKEDLGKQK